MERQVSLQRGTTSVDDTSLNLTRRGIFGAPLCLSQGLKLIFSPLPYVVSVVTLGVSVWVRGMGSVSWHSGGDFVSQGASSSSLGFNSISERATITVHPCSKG